MPDAIFDDPRLAAVYDPLDPDRSDLDGYLAIAEEFSAGTVLDVGCGTGTLAVMLAARGVHVVGVDPAGASLEVARRKPAADLVSWVHGTASDLPAMAADLAVMTANVAQVFLTDDEWAETLLALRERLRDGGHLVFETRDPARRAWERWNPEDSLVTVDVPGVGRVSSWEEVRRVELPLVTFDSHTVFHHSDTGDEDLLSVSTLRFRSCDVVRASLLEAGFCDIEVRDLFYRPGHGWVFVAANTGTVGPESGADPSGGEEGPVDPSRSS